MLNLFRTAAFLAILMLCAAHSLGQCVYIGSNPVRVGSETAPIVGFRSCSFISSPPNILNGAIIQDTLNIQDTIKVFLQVADTSMRGDAVCLQLICGYEVRKVDSIMTQVAHDPNKITYHANGVYGSTLMGVIYKWVKVPKYTHLLYLNKSNHPLDKKYLVFNVHPRG